jgi:hypothetical protein
VVDLEAQLENGSTLLRKFQIVIDAKDPVRLVDFWTKALGYVVEPPPKGFSSWVDFYRKIGLQEEELTEGPDCIVDPEIEKTLHYFSA